MIKIPNSALQAVGAKNADEFWAKLGELFGAVETLQADAKAQQELIAELSEKLEAKAEVMEPATAETETSTAASDNTFDFAAFKDELLKEAKSTASRTAAEALANTGTTAPVKASAATDGNEDGAGAANQPADFSNMDREQLEAAWATTPAIRAEFYDKDSFVGYHLANNAGLIR